MLNIMFYTVPPPVNVTVTSDPVSPIRPIGSAVSLSCTVELSPAVDVPVTVNTVWTGPDRFMTTNTAQPVMGNTYSSSVMISSIWEREIWKLHMFSFCQLS